jgi:FkbM family methyltransferase
MALFGIVIPLRPAISSVNWEVESRLLKQTIGSVLNQSYQGFKIFIIYTDMPLYVEKDSRIQYIQFPFGFKTYDEIDHREELLGMFKTKKLVVARWDKARKINYGSKLVIEEKCDYLMSLDSDDLVSNRVLSFCNAQSLGKVTKGWYVEKGYIYNRERKNYLIKVPRDMRFINGSTHILSTDLVTIPDNNSTNWQDYNLFTDHGWIKDRVKETNGAILEAIPFPAVIYVVHGSNISKIKREFGLKLKYIAKRIMRGVWLTKKLRKEFNIQFNEETFKNKLQDNPVKPRGHQKNIFTKVSSGIRFRVTELAQIFSFINRHPLAGKHRIKAYLRFFTWQFAQKVHPGERVHLFTQKSKLILKKGLSGGTGNIYTGLHDFEEMAFLLHVLREHDLFADIGANIGSYTVLASSEAGAKTNAFEPIPQAFKWLAKNIQLNKLEQKVSLFPIGLGEKKEILSFTFLKGAENHVISKWEKEDESIPVTMDSFDALCFPEQVPVLVKIDVEGFEAEVLKGMQKSLLDERLKAIIIELNGSGYRYDFDEKKIHEDLIKIGFKPFEYNPFERSLKPLPKFGIYNTIYIRDLDFIEKRVLSARKIKIFGEKF